MKNLIWLILSLVIVESDRIFPQDISDSAVARRYVERAEYFKQQAQHDSSKTHYERARAVFENIEDWPGVINCCNEIAEALWKQKKLDPAIEYLNENVLQRFADLHTGEIPEELGAALGRTHLLLGRLHRGNRAYDSAISQIEKALDYFKLARARTDSVDLARCYSLGGRVLRVKGEYDQALKFHEKSLAIRLSLFGEDNLTVANEYHRIGITLRKKSDYERAFDYYNKALAISRRLPEDNPSFLSSLYNNIGNIFADRNDYQTAISYHRKALKIDSAAAEPNHAMIASRYHNIGNEYRKFGILDSAVVYVSKGVEGFENSVGENHPWTAMGYFLLAAVQAEQGEYDRAIETSKKSLAVRLSLFGRHHRDTAQAYLSLADVYYRKGNFRAAIRWAQEALSSMIPDFAEEDIYVNPILDRVAKDEMIFWALKWKADSFRRLYGRSDEVRDGDMALGTYELVAEFIDQMRIGHRAEASRLALGEDVLEILEEAIQTATTLYQRTGQRQYWERAFLLAGKGKAAVLSAAIQDSEARGFGGIPETLLEQVKNLQTSVADYEANLQKEKLTKEDADTLKIQELETKVFALTIEYDALMQNLEREYPDYYDLKYQTQVACPEDLQKFLDEETAMIEYFVGDSTIFIFLITKNNIEVKSVAKDTSFTSMVSEVHKSIKKLDADQFIQTSRKLYIDLIEPVKREIASMKKLIIIPDGILLKIPFEVLLTQRPTTAEQVDFTKVNFMVNKYEISYHYSATLFLNSVERGNYLATKVRPQSRGDFLGFAPVFSDQPQPGYELASKYPIVSFEFSDEETRAATIDGQHFRELKYSQTEVESLIKEFEKHGRAGVAFFHGDASEENFKKQAHNYEYIHVATHGLIHADEPRLSGIIFAQPTDSTANEDGILYSAETYNLELNADLITLSSCESGIGKLVRGEGLMALTRGFLYSGARNIIVSLWKVSDKHTSQLMIELYKNILEGKSYSAALREAKLMMLKNPATAFPKSWSSFVLIGQ